MHQNSSWSNAVASLRWSHLRLTQTRIRTRIRTRPTLTLTLTPQSPVLDPNRTLRGPVLPDVVVTGLLLSTLEIAVAAEAPAQAEVAVGRHRAEGTGRIHVRSHLVGAPLRGTAHATGARAHHLVEAASGSLCPLLAADATIKIPGRGRTIALLVDPRPLVMKEMKGEKGTMVETGTMGGGHPPLRRLLVIISVTGSARRTGIMDGSGIVGTVEGVEMIGTTRARHHRVLEGSLLDLPLGGPRAGNGIEDTSREGSD